MRRHLSYANVMSTLGVFIALGGSSYAAVKISGKDVKDGSLTGRDLKRGSVQLNRLRGSLPRGPVGPAGAQGTQGPQGPPGSAATVDTSAFLRKGEVQLVAPAHLWEPANPTGGEDATTARLTEIDDTEASLSVPLPVLLAGRAARLTAVDVCYDATDPAAADIGTVSMPVYRSDRSAGPLEGSTLPGSLTPNAPLTTEGCVRLDRATPVALTGDDVVEVRASRVGGGVLHLGRVTLTLTLD